MDARNSKEILLSVKPPFANLIVDGIKTIELRRKFPEDIRAGTRCLIYSTSPVQKVIGECRIAEVRRLKLHELWNESATKAMISWAAFSEYFSGLEYGYAVTIYAHLRYDEAQDLPTIAGATAKAPQSYRYLPAGHISTTV
ncbi:MAG: ASCH domain-containing protein [Bacteriovoracia bacterium]